MQVHLARGSKHYKYYPKIAIRCIEWSTGTQIQTVARSGFLWRKTEEESKPRSRLQGAKSLRQTSSNPAGVACDKASHIFILASVRVLAQIVLSVPVMGTFFSGAFVP